MALLAFWYFSIGGAEGGQQRAHLQEKVVPIDRSTPYVFKQIKIFVPNVDLVDFVRLSENYLMSLLLGI